MRLVPGIFLAATCIAACADTTGAAEQVSESAVVDTLATRSGIPANELQGFLSNCDASQQSMYFCAYRDLVREELSLDRAVLQRKDAACTSDLQQTKAEWITRRDAACRKTAAAEFGGGSMEPTARLMCMSEETQRTREALEAKSRCKF